MRVDEPPTRRDSPFSRRRFWIRSVGGTNLLRFADNDCSTTPAVGTFRDQW